LQLAIDVATGAPFLDEYETSKCAVFYVDYENRPKQLKARALDLREGRDVSNVLVKSFDFLTDRDVGLDGDSAKRLKDLVADHQPGLLILDPLRFAAPKGDSKEENWAVNVVDQVSSLREWVWPAPTKQGHVWHDSIRIQHKHAIEKSKLKKFVIYSLRHTFLTRLGESGCDAWTLARIAGHSSTKMSERYVHPSTDAVFSAFSRMPRQEAVALATSDGPKGEALEMEILI